MARNKPPSRRKRKAADEEEKQQQEEASGAAGGAANNEDEAAGDEKEETTKRKKTNGESGANASDAGGALATATDAANGGPARSVADLEAELTVSEAESKRKQNAINAIVKEYSCPLSLELPVDPVIAEDVRTYNRADIQKHIDNVHDPDDEEDEYKYLRSPVTNEQMGPSLFPAVQVQNVIRSLVESRAIDEDDAEQWKKVDDMRTNANNGDPKAMCELGDWYYHGENGLVEDEELSYSWYQKAADLGCNPAKAAAGYMLYKGEGTVRRCAEGVLLLGIAATKGSSLAAYYLADFHYEGGDEDKGYFAKDNAKAKFWLDEATRLRKKEDEFEFYAVGLEELETLKKKLENKKKDDEPN